MSFQPPGTAPINFRRFLWIPVFALCGAVVGYGASFLFGVKYTASTRLLMRVNNTSFLQTNGSTIDKQNASVEQSAISRTVSETQGALLGNEVVARKLVDKLNLDRNDDPTGPIGFVKKVFATTFKVTYSYALKGTYKKLPRHEQAVKDAQKNLSASQVGLSYIIAVKGSWKDAETATKMSNAAADELVAMTNRRFREDIEQAEARILAAMTETGERQQQAALKLGTFANANRIDLTTEGAVLSPTIATLLSPAAQTELVTLQTDYITTTTTMTGLTAKLQELRVNGGVAPVELTRLDTAVPGVYPSAPKRWMYEALFLVLGAIVGLAMAARSAWRDGETLFPKDDEYGIPAYGAYSYAQDDEYEVEYAGGAASEYAEAGDDYGRTPPTSPPGT